MDRQQKTSGFEPTWLDEINEDTMDWAKDIAQKKYKSVTTSQLRNLLSRLNKIKVKMKMNDDFSALKVLKNVMKDMDNYEEVKAAVKDRLEKVSKKEYNRVREDVSLLLPQLHFAGAKEKGPVLRKFLGIITDEMIPATKDNGSRVKNMIKIVEAIISFHRQPK